MSRLDGFETHPDEISVASYLEGRLPEQARAAIEAHFADCDECRRALILLQGLEDQEEEPAPREWTAPTRKRSWHSWAAAAAAVILGALFVLPLTEQLPLGEGGAPVYRSLGSGGPGPLHPAAGDLVDRDDVFFSWTPVEGADGYRVRVWSAGTGFVLEFDVSGGQTEAGWPGDADPAPAGELVWRVRALSLDRTIAESPPVPFEIGE